MNYNPQYDYYRIGRARISVTNIPDSVDRIKKYIVSGIKGYVCVSNMRTTVLANINDDYWSVMEHSLFNTPDGTPVLWCGKLWGINQVDRTCGPHLFEKLLNDHDSVLKHYFLGDTDETLEKLTSKCRTDYGAQVVGSYSPPFLPLERFDLEGIAKMINESGATIVWTALKAPKQDILASQLLPYLNKGIIVVGVGAAFRCVIGELKKPDGFLQKIGLAGLLIRRKGNSRYDEFIWYIKHTCYLLIYMVQIVGKRLLNKPYWE